MVQPVRNTLITSSLAPIFYYQIEDVTWPHGDMKFLFECQHWWNNKPFYICAKGVIYYVIITTVIFSHVKVTSYFHVWRYHVFARKLNWYFIGVYMIRCNILQSLKKFYEGTSEPP